MQPFLFAVRLRYNEKNYSIAASGFIQQSLFSDAGNNIR
jgi:hypothetical protein